MNGKTTPWLLLAVLILAIGAVHVAALRRGHDWGDDFAMYILHARNLAQAVPYAATGYVYNPHYPAVGPPTYPPITPLLLAPVYGWFGLNLTAMKLVMVCCFLLFLLLLFLCFRREIPLPYVFSLVALIGLNHFFIHNTNTVNSDEPFLVFLYLGILLITAADDPAAAPRRRTALCLAAGVVAYLAFGTRTLGAVLIPSLLLSDFLHTRRITRPVLLATLVFAGLAIAQSAVLHSDRHYLDQFGAGPAVLLANAAGYVARLAAFFSNGYSKAAAVPIAAAVTLLAILGYVEQLKRKITVCEVFLVFYLAVILLWPGYEGERYLYPILPLWLFYAICGLEHPWLARRAGLRRALVGLLLAAVLVSYAARYTTLEFGPMSQGVAHPNSKGLFQYIAARTDPQDVIVFVKPRAMALFAGRRASVYHQPREDRELWDYFRGIGATHVVVVERDESLKYAERPELLEFLRGFAARHRTLLDEVYRNDDFTVYKIKSCEPPVL